MQDSRLVRAAEFVLSTLAHELGESNASLLVANNDARILKTWVTSRNLARQLERVGSVPGHSAAENVVGTNGIGTTAAELRANMVVGAEHMSDFLTDFACAGAPILDPMTGRVEGIVTLTARAADASPILPSLINQAARAIHRELVSLSTIGEQMLLDAYLAAVRAGRSVVVVGTGVHLQMPNAAGSLAQVDGQRLWFALSEVLSASTPRATIVIQSGSAEMSLDCSAVMLGDKVVGAIAELAQQPSNSRRTAQRKPAPNAWTPLAQSLPGASRAWAHTRDQAELGMRANLPMVAFGESGSGKFTLVQHMLRRTAPDREPTYLDCVQARRERDSWIRTLDSSLSGPGPVILRHIDALKAAVALDVANSLSARPDLVNQGLVLGTAASEGSWSVEPELRALLDLLAVGRIKVPSLRERRQDMRLLLTGLERKYSSASAVISREI